MANKKFVIQNQEEEIWTIEFYIDGQFHEYIRCTPDEWGEQLLTYTNDGWTRGYFRHEVDKYRAMLDGMRQIVEFMEKNIVNPQS